MNVAIFPAGFGGVEGVFVNDQAWGSEGRSLLVNRFSFPAERGARSCTIQLLEKIYREEDFILSICFGMFKDFHDFFRRLWDLSVCDTCVQFAWSGSPEVRRDDVRRHRLYASIVMHFAGGFALIRWTTGIAEP